MIAIKRIFSLCIVTTMLLTVVACNRKEQAVETNPMNQKVIYATLFPQYDFVKQIAKDKIDVRLLLPPGTEAHTFDPTPKLIAEVSKAEMVIFTNELMEPWIKQVKNVSNNQRVIFLDASEGITLIEEAEHTDAEHTETEQENAEHTDTEQENAENRESEHKDAENKEAEHTDAGQEDAEHTDTEQENAENKEAEHTDAAQEEAEHKEVEHKDDRLGGKDPHIWLDPTLAAKMVDNILEGLIKVDPQNKSFYQQNASVYQLKLKELDQDYQEAILQFKSKTIVYGGHFAFGYLAKRYRLVYISPYKGFSPNAEPSPAKIAELMGVLENSGAKAVYFEENIDPKVARILSEQTGAKLLLLHGAHNLSKQELQEGITYLTIMKDNLQRLQEGLGYE